MQKKLGDLLPGEWFVCASISADDVWVKSSGGIHITEQSESLIVSLFTGEARYESNDALCLRMIRVDPRDSQRARTGGTRTL